MFTYQKNKISGLRTKEDLMAAMLLFIPRNLTNDDVLFLCIGTDRSTGDCLAPLVGMYLQELGYKNVYGTIDDPIHGDNLREALEKIPQNKKVIAVDAVLGSNINTLIFKKGSIKPGAAINHSLPEVGDYGILGVVNIDTGNYILNSATIQSTRLSLTIKMAKTIVSAINEVFPLSEGNCYINNEVAVGGVL